jgi:hypothetical protein
MNLARQSIHLRIQPNVNQYANIATKHKAHRKLLECKLSRRLGERQRNRRLPGSGYVSGWQGSKKATVEGSLALTASALVRKKALVLVP